MNPFGVPISTETLEQMRRYKGISITREDLARESMRLIHAEDKNLSALQHALKLKQDYGDGVSTLCLFYNATGGKLELVARQDWSGSVYKDEPPTSFENGQWLAFLHTHPEPSTDGSEAARVYRGKNVKGEDRDFMVAWNNRYTKDPNNAYTEVREKDHFPHYWSYIKGLLERSNKITKDDDGDTHCSSIVSIGGYTTSECIAVFKHKFGPLPEN